MHWNLAAFGRIVRVAVATLPLGCAGLGDPGVDSRNGSGSTSNDSTSNDSTSNDSTSNDSTSNDSASNETSPPNVEPCSGSAAPDGRKFCEIRADRMAACKNAPRQATLDTCRNPSYGIDDDRFDCRFVTQWGACVDALSCEQNLEDCAAVALRAFDPTLLGANDESPEPAGSLAECHRRCAECALSDDDCLSATVLREPYRTQALACITNTCATLRTCLDSAVGRNP